MSKDAYYFPHDSNAKDDPKCVMLIEQLGLEGYGIYWMLIETLRDQPDYTYPTKLLRSLARRYNTTFEKVNVVVFNYDLFIIKDEQIFFSQSLVNRMIPLERKREFARLAGQKSAEKRALNQGVATTVQRPLNEGSTIRVKKSKIKESEIEEKTDVFAFPTLSEIEAYFAEKGYSKELAQKFFEYYSEAQWRDSTGKLVRNWKQKSISVWFKEEYKQQLNQQHNEQSKYSVKTMQFPD